MEAQQLLTSLLSIALFLTSVGWAYTGHLLIDTWERQERGVLLRQKREAVKDTAVEMHKIADIIEEGNFTTKFDFRKRAEKLEELFNFTVVKKDK